MKKTFCDVCGKEFDARTNFGAYFEYRGPNTVSWARNYDLCEECGVEVFQFIHDMKS